MEQLKRDRIIWDFLLDKTGNKYGAAALIGNLYAESKLIPDALEYLYHDELGFNSMEYTKAVDNGDYGDFVTDRAGYGLAQWTLAKRKEKLLRYAKDKGVSISDIHMQLDFLWLELNEDYPQVLDALKNAVSIKPASDIVLAKYENPADQGIKARMLRAAYGKRFLYRYIDLKQLDEELQKISRWRDDISFCLADLPSGRIIYQRNADLLRPVGSIAKLMAAYVLLDRVFKDKLKLKETVTIDKETSEMSCSRDFSGGEHFGEGEQLEAERLFELMLVNSSCPGTLALVKHFFDSQEQFLEIMNASAKRLGMNAHFEDIIGVSPYNSCSAADTVKMGTNILREYPEILEYTSMKGVVLKGINYPNSNRFVSEGCYVQGVDGLKTGTTLCAGRCFLATAKRDSRRVISIVLGAMEREELYDETTGLLEYGLEHGR